MSADQPPTERTIPGRWIVIGMFAFGIAATAGLWIYWKLHLAPFYPLQKALAEEFPKSLPRVEGGRHKKSPPILRIVLQVTFTPNKDDSRVRDMHERIVAVARQHHDLSQYETLEVYLVHPVPEREAERLKLEDRIAELPTTQ